MARRRRKGKGRRGSRAIPLLALAPIYPAVSRLIKFEQPMSDTPGRMLYELTGYNPFTQQYEIAKGKSQVVLVIAGIVGHKIANRLGVNKYVKKMTGGFLQL